MAIDKTQNFALVNLVPSLVLTILLGLISITAFAGEFLLDVQDENTQISPPVKSKPIIRAVEPKPVSKSVVTTQSDKQSTLANENDSDRLYWPMLPGESLEQMASKFYPDSPILKQRFILKVKSLNRASNPNLEANQRFKSPQLIIIPNDKAVRELTHKIKKAADIQPHEQTLTLSYDLHESAAAGVTLSKPIEVPTTASTQASSSPLQKPVQESDQQKTEVVPAKVAENTQMTLPKVESPSVSLPTVDFTKYTSMVSEQLYRVYHGSIKLAKFVKRKAVRLIKDFDGKTVNQISADAHLRNAILIGLLLLLLPIFWIVSKVHHRKRDAKLLSGVELVRNEDNINFVVPATEEAATESPPAVDVPPVNEEMQAEVATPLEEDIVIETPPQDAPQAAAVTQAEEAPPTEVATSFVDEIEALGLAEEKKP
jgi:hypothetical protein